MTSLKYAGKVLAAKCHKKIHLKASYPYSLLCTFQFPFSTTSSSLFNFQLKVSTTEHKYTMSQRNDLCRISVYPPVAPANTSHHIKDRTKYWRNKMENIDKYDCLLDISRLSLYIERTNIAEYFFLIEHYNMQKPNQQFKNWQLPAKFSFSSSESNCFFCEWKFCRAVSNIPSGTAEHSTAFWRSCLHFFIFPK